MNEFQEALAWTVGSFSSIYATIMIGGSLMQSLTSEKINSQEQLDVVVGEEADKLSLERKNLVSKFFAKTDKNYNMNLGHRAGIEDYDVENDELVHHSNKKNILPMQILEITEGFGATRNTVRHELYHLKGKHVPKTSTLKHYLCNEPRAIIYAITGLQL